MVRIAAAAMIQLLVIAGSYLVVKDCLPYAISDKAAFVLAVVFGPAVWGLGCITLCCSILLLTGSILFLPVWLSYLWNGLPAANRTLAFWFNLASKYCTVDKDFQAWLTEEALIICQEIDLLFSEIGQGQWRRF
jgi:hypothetical protein